MTRITSLAPFMRRSSRSYRLRTLMPLAAALAITPTSLLAEAQVQGSPEAVRIETQNSSIEEVLAALGNAFDLRYRSSANLAKQLSGTYEGSLQRVVARLLEGYDFVLRNNKGKIEITVLGTRNAGQAGAVASSTSNSPKAASGSAAPAPAAVPSKAADQPAPTIPPSTPAAIPTKVAERPGSEIVPPLPFSDPTKVAELGAAAPVPTPIPGSGTGPIPELIPGAAAVPAPTPSSGPAPFPEPVAAAAAVPPPGADLSSAPVPAPTPAAPQPTGAGPSPVAPMPQ